VEKSSSLKGWAVIVVICIALLGGECFLLSKRDKSREQRKVQECYQFFATRFEVAPPKDVAGFDYQLEVLTKIAIYDMQTENNRRDIAEIVRKTYDSNGIVKDFPLLAQKGEEIESLTHDLVYRERILLEAKKRAEYLKFNIVDPWTPIEKP
jgi:hypothetical protein